MLSYLYLNVLALFRIIVDGIDLKQDFFPSNFSYFSDKKVSAISSTTSTFTHLFFTVFLLFVRTKPYGLI